LNTTSVSTRQRFNTLVAQITEFIAHRPLNEALEAELNHTFPFAGTQVAGIFECCRMGIAEGWMCSREAGDIRFGRVIKAEPATCGFSVDVVDMQPIAGPHHRHPNGEIDLIMPLAPGAQFDGHDAGWMVYGPGSSHSPTVTRGRALVLYLLPQGAIEFTQS
jgi:hypothetical protein